MSDTLERLEPPTARATPPLASDSGALLQLLATAVTAVADGAAERSGPLPAGGPEQVAATVREVLGEPLPTEGDDPAAVLTALSQRFAAGAADPSDPACAGHLHCPPLAIAVAADLVAGLLNQSLDSWDQAPAGIEIERDVVTALAELVGYEPRSAGGTMTSGGTESNLLGLLLARQANPGLDVTRGRVLCSPHAHFSLQRAAEQLGLGPDAVSPVATDAQGRLDPAALDSALTAVAHRGDHPVAVVATAGTTDRGSIDPLRPVARVAADRGVWLHVDAAYGGGALFSDRLAALLDGVHLADSVALDLHKLGWQPVPAGALLTRDDAAFTPLARSVAYLNPADDEAAGYPSRLRYSLRTTRRADAFKVAVTLRALGRSGLGELVDRCHELATHAATRIDADPQLDLLAQPVLTTVLFRYRADDDPTHPAGDDVNARLRRRLLERGQAVVGRTELDGRTALKLTLLNPRTTPADLDRLLAEVVHAGELTDSGEHS